jgi:hypothetical protein
VLSRDRLFVRYPSITWERTQERLDIGTSTINHELGVIDGKVAWTEAIRKRTDILLGEYVTWPALYQFKTAHPSGSMVTLKPDARSSTRVAYTNKPTIAFHEHDRGTEGVQRIVAKAYGYAYYYQSGDFAVRMGGTRKERAEFLFRVLIDVKNIERRNNIVEALLKESHTFTFRRLFALTTTSEFLADPIGNIWLTLDNYFDATRGTIYNPLTHTATRRVSERDRLVEARITKRAFPFPSKQKGDSEVESPETEVA